LKREPFYVANVVKSIPKLSWTICNRACNSGNYNYARKREEKKGRSRGGLREGGRREKCTIRKREHRGRRGGWTKRARPEGGGDCKKRETGEEGEGAGGENV